MKSLFPCWFKRGPKAPTSIHEVEPAAVPDERADQRAEILSRRLTANLSRSLRRSIQIREALADEQFLALKGGPH